MPSPNVKPHLIVTIHGIRTFGKWQERLEQLVRQENTEVGFYHYKLGYFSLLAFLVPPLRWLVVRRFRNELRALVKSTSWARIDLVGHSFGTHVIGWALWGLRFNESISIHTVILSGSVLRSGFNWSRLIGSRVHRVVNDCGARDRVLLLSQFFVLFTGMAGRTGFSGMTSQRFRNRVSMFGHSGYFQDAHGKLDDHYMRDHWVDLLVSEKPIPHFNHLPEGGALNGIVLWMSNNAVLWMSNNAEPVKLSLYLAPLIAVTLWVWAQGQEAVTQRQEAEENELRAVANEERAIANEQIATQRLSEALANQSRFVANVGKEILTMDPARSLALVLAVLPKTVTHPDRPIVPEALSVAYRAAATDRTVGILVGHGADVTSAGFSPDGLRIVTAAADKTARIWDANTGATIVALQGHTAPVRTAAFSPDGRRVVTASRDKTARVWDASSGRELAVLRHDDWVHMALFNPSGNLIVTASEQTARVWSAETGAEVAVLRGYKDAIGTVTFSPDGNLIAAAAWDMGKGEKTAYVWEANTGAIKWRLRGHTDVVTWVAFSRDGRYLVTGSGDNTARIWEASTGRQTAVLRGHTDLVATVVFSRDGSRIVTASDDKSVRVWDAKTGNVKHVLQGHTDSIVAAHFSPDGKSIVTASPDKTARMWDAETGAEVAVLRHETEVLSAIFNPQGTRIITVSAESRVRIWDTSVGPKIILPNADDGESNRNTIAFGRKGARVVTTPKDHTARVWDAKTGAQTAILRGHNDSVYTAVFNADDSRILTASGDGTARVWDAISGAQLGELRGHNSIVWTASFSGDDKTIVTASSDHTVRIWDAKSFAHLKSLEHKDAVYNASLNDDATRVLTLAGKRARLWSTNDGSLITEFGSDSEPISTAAFSPDGRRIAQSGSIRIWGADSGTQLLALRNAGTWVFTASFSSDGKQVVAGLGDRTARIWNSESGAELRVLHVNESNVQIASFTADNRLIVTATTFGNNVHVWDALTGAEIQVVSVAPDDLRRVAISNDGTLVAIALRNNSVQVSKINATSSEIWLPGTRARSFRGVDFEDRRRYFPMGQHVRAKMDPCDELAGDPFDPNKIADGILDETGVAGAIATCRIAQRAHPSEPRFSYQLARLLAADTQYEAAEDAYKAASRAGYPMASYGLALLYWKGGRGINKDTQKARELLTKAFDLNVASAGSVLGQLFWDGDGVEPNRDNARDIWKQAADRGDPHSHQKLAWLAELGREGTPQDLNSALFHYSIAARLVDHPDLNASVVRLRSNNRSRRISRRCCGDLGISPILEAEIGPIRAP